MPRFKYIYIAILIMLVSIACKKELNVYPTTSEVDGNVISDSASARVVLNGVYYRLANVGSDAAGNPATQWVSIWEYLPSESVGTVYSSYYLDEISSFQFDYTSSYISSIWSYGYNIVNAANGFIKNLNASTKLTTSAKASLLAEGKFLRAFGNEMLMLYFAQYGDTTSQYGIILRNEFVSSSTITLPRNSVKECYDSILADIDFAIDNLPASNASNIYASRAAAKILKARILINRKVGDDIQNVVDITKDIIQNETTYSLEDSLKDIFLDKGFSSKEVILGIQSFNLQNLKFSFYQQQEKYTVTDTLRSIVVREKSWEMYLAPPFFIASNYYKQGYESKFQFFRTASVFSDNYFMQKVRFAAYH